MRKIKNYVFHLRLKRAIKEANALKELTGKKYLVFRYNNRLIVKSKQDLKYLLKQGIFKASAGMRELESIALYSTL